MFSQQPMEITLLRRTFLCRHCKERKPVALLAKRKRTVCQQCRSKQHYASKLKSVYGITLKEYTAMFEAQHGCCAICRQPEWRYSARSRARKLLCVDHDHRTGEVRQLLCDRCNRVLGLLEEDATLLRAMTRYLKKHAPDSDSTTLRVA